MVELSSKYADVLNRLLEDTPIVLPTIPFAMSVCGITQVTERPKSCPNCGAPARHAECEYCGTVLWKSIEYVPYYMGEVWNPSEKMYEEGDEGARHERL